MKNRIFLFLSFIFAVAHLYSQTQFHEDSAIYYLEEIKSKIPLADSNQLLKADKAEFYATGAENDSLLAMAWYLKGVLYYYSGFYEASNTYYQKALLNPVNGQNPDIRFRLLNNSGINYDMLGNPEEALKYYHQALEIVRLQENEKGLAQLKINMGRLYRITRDFDKSESYLNESLDYFKTAQDTFYLGLVYQNMASLYSDIGKDEQVVLNAYRSALEYYQAISYSYGIVELNHNLGDYYQTVEGDMHKAAHYFKKALEISEENKMHQNSVPLLLALGKIALISEDYLQAENYAEQGYELAKQNNILSWQQASLKLITEIRIELGLKSQAKQALKEYISFSDSVFNIEKAKSYNELSVLYEIKHKNEHLQNQQLEIVKHKTHEKWLIITLVLVLLLTILLMYFMRFRAKKLRQQYKLNRELFEKEKLLIEEVALTDTKMSTTDISDKHQELYYMIMDLMKTKKLFTDPNVSVSVLADELSTNQKYISQAINEHSGMSFPHFLNKQRVQEARRLIEENGRLGLSLEQVMNRSGFRSRTTFSDAFKKFTGMTPGQYQKYAHEIK